MKIDGVSFNQQWAWGKSQEEFVNEFKDLDHIFPDTPDKSAKLREVHSLLQQGKPADSALAKFPSTEAKKIEKPE